MSKKNQQQSKGKRLRENSTSGPLRSSQDGHCVLTEDQKVLKTTRIVSYDLLEEETKEQKLTESGWTWSTDPDGRTFYQNKNNTRKVMGNAVITSTG